MKIQNPFDDWVFDTRKSTRKIDFVAESPKLKEFKDNIEPILDYNDNSVRQFHSIVGDFGTGKSHINHYIHDRANEEEHMLASFVSCKNLIQSIDDEKKLFNLLLNALIVNLKEKAPDNLKSIIGEIYDNALGDKKIERAKNDLKNAKAKNEKEQIEYYTWVLEKAYEERVLKKDTFFNILEEIKETEIYRNDIRRIIFIIDEFEIFDSDHHYKDLKEIWAIREDINRHQDIIWLFSCAGGSWKSLSEEKTADLFGKDTMIAHFIPRYDKDDRREMIWSRMLSLVENYSPERRNEFRNSDSLREHCFPFFNKNVNGEFLDGNYLVDLLSKPDIYPRRLISNCYDFFADYQDSLRDKDEVYAYNKAKKELFKKHFFDIIDEGKFDIITRIIWEKIHNHYLSKAGRKEDFEIHLRNLIQVYITRRIKGKTLIGFEKESIHLSYVSKFMQLVLKSESPINPNHNNAFSCLKDIEKELRERCLEELEDPTTGFKYLEFRFKDFQPEGSIPYLTEIFHRDLDKEAGPSGLITEDQMKEILTNLLKRERNQSYDDYIFRTKKNELIEAQKIEFDEKNHKGYFVLNRSERKIEQSFYDEFKNITRKSERNPDRFFEILRDEKRAFFLPPLENKNGKYYLEIKSISKNSPGKSRKQKLRVHFWTEIPSNPINILHEDEPSLIISTVLLNDFKKAGLILKNHQTLETFKTFISEEDQPSFYVMIPNDDPIDIFDFMTWKDFYLFFDEIEKASKKLNFESGIDQLKKKLQHEIIQLPNRINRLPQFRWDESDIYHLRFKSVGQTSIQELKKLLSQILSRDSIVVTMQNKKQLDILTSFYPWLTIDGHECKKIKSKCMKQILGKDVNEGVFELYQIMQNLKEPTNLDVVAEEYLIRNERLNNIIDETKTKEKKSTHLTTILLLHALEDTFPDIFQIKDEKISLIKEIEFDNWDDENLTWLFSIKDEDTLNLISEIINNIDGVPKLSFLEDIRISKEFHNEYIKSKDKKILAYKESSKIFSADIERHNLLTYFQEIIKKLVIDLNVKTYRLKKFSTTTYEKAKDIQEQAKILFDDESTSQNIRNQIENMLSNSGLNEMVSRYEASKENLKIIQDLDDVIDPKNPDFSIWIQIMKENPIIFKEVYKIHGTLNETTSRLTESIATLEETIKLIIEEEKEFVINFQVFIKQNSRILESLNNYEITEELIDYRKKVEKLDVSNIENPFMFLELINKRKSEINRIIKILEKASSDIINQINDEYQRSIDNLLQLSIRYTENINETEQRFNLLKKHIKNEMDTYKEKSIEGIKELKDLERWLIEEPGKKKEVYEKKAHDLIKKSISKQHYQYLNQTLDDIKKNNLIKSLFSIKQGNGEKEFEDRLKFLLDMENCGILSYG